MSTENTIEYMIHHFTIDSLKILYLDCLSKNEILRANLIVDIIDIYEEIKNIQNLMDIILEKININTDLVYQYQEFIRLKVIEYECDLSIVQNLEEYKELNLIKDIIKKQTKEYNEYKDNLYSLRHELKECIQKDLAFLMLNYLTKR
jgi:hypothetical protein